MAGLLQHRWRRMRASGSPVLLGGGTALLIALATLVVANSPTPGATTETFALAPWLFYGLVVAAGIGLICLALQWTAEYRKRTYDPTWALKFDAIFNSEDMLRSRSLAATELRDNQAKLRDKGIRLPRLEDVLDFFEDIGFYLEGDQITPEVAHHAFYYWLRCYYAIAREYIEGGQDENPAAWEYVPRLFEMLFQIENERAKDKARKFPDTSALNDFLEEEIIISAQ